MQAFRRGVSKSSSRGRGRRHGREASKTAAGGDGGGGNECSVCFEPMGAPMAFPCGHSNCATCFARVEHCPLCRTGKDGTTGEARREAAAAATRGALPGVEVVVVVGFRGTQGGSPLDFTVNAGMPPSLVELLPSAVREELRSGEAAPAPARPSAGMRPDEMLATLRGLTHVVRNRPVRVIDVPAGVPEIGQVMRVARRGAPPREEPM